MSKPKYLVSISFNDYAQCLGKQLAEILKQIKLVIPNATWYGADVEITGTNAYRLGLQGWIPKKIGSIDDLISISNSVSQFLCGVFLALPKDIGTEWDVRFATEDESFRDINIAIIEIRAFDTSYFDVYSNDLNIIKRLSNFFSTKIEYSQ